MTHTLQIQNLGSRVEVKCLAYAAALTHGLAAVRPVPCEQRGAALCLKEQLLCAPTNNLLTRAPPSARPCHRTRPTRRLQQRPAAPWRRPRACCERDARLAPRGGPPALLGTRGEFVSGAPRCGVARPDAARRGAARRSGSHVPPASLSSPVACACALECVCPSRSRSSWRWSPCLLPAAARRPASGRSLAPSGFL